MGRGSGAQSPPDEGCRLPVMGEAGPDAAERPREHNWALWWPQAGWSFLKETKASHEGRKQNDVNVVGPGGLEPQKQAQKRGGLYSGDGSNSRVREQHHKICYWCLVTSPPSLQMFSRERKGTVTRCQSSSGKFMPRKGVRMGATKLLFPPACLQRTPTRTGGDFWL